MMQINLKDYFIKALNTQPNFSEAHLQLALLYQEEGDHNNVIKHFESAISSDLEDAEKLEEKGDELLKNFQFQNAKDQFVKSQEKKIHCAEVYYQQAIYFRGQNNNQSVQKSLEKSIKMNSALPEAHRDLGILFVNQKQLDNARIHLEKALDINYADSISHIYLGKVMMLMKDYEDAEQHFLSALDINPKFADCMIEMAQLKLRMKQNQEAQEYYVKAKEINPELKNQNWKR